MPESPPRSNQVVTDDLIADQLSKRLSEQDDKLANSSSEEDSPKPRRMAVSALIFAVATAFSRVAGLAREILVANYFGVTGAASAYTLASQVPNTLRGLLADAALPAAFVPAFTELLEKGKRREAIELASALFTLVVIALGAVVAIFLFLAPVILPLFISDDFPSQYTSLAVGLSQVMFITVVLIGVISLVVGILNAYNHFTIAALAPVAWNVVIIASLVGMRSWFTGSDEIYAYAIGIVIGTVVQLAMALAALKRINFPLSLSFNFRNPKIKEVLILMFPVSIGLGLINIDIAINAAIGSMISIEAPAAIDRAFRLYSLPQGIFSVAVATVIFPTLSRLAVRRDFVGLRAINGNGLRLIGLLLIPAAAAMIALPEPITRLVYQRGEFTPSATSDVAQALIWFPVSLPFAGANFLLTKAFFSIQKPWLPTGLALGSLVINTAVSFALYKPLGIPGPIIGTVIANIAMTLGLAYYLRRHIGGLELAKTLRAVVLMIGASIVMGAVIYGLWFTFDDVFGAEFFGQLISVGGSLIIGGVIYFSLLLWLKQSEAQQIMSFIRGRISRSS